MFLVTPFGILSALPGKNAEYQDVNESGSTPASTSGERFPTRR
jgi:hypothetical protein